MVMKKKTRTKVISHPAMKMYLDAKKHDSILLGDVDRHIQMLPSDRDTTVLHPSEMARTDWCPRASWHRLAGHSLTGATDPLVLRRALFFDEGKAIHTKWQQWLRDMGILWGRWVCAICKLEKYLWSSSLPTVCLMRTDGDRHIWEYKEVPLSDLGLRIAGHADGVVAVNDETYLLEIKSVGPGTLRALSLMLDDDEDEISSTRFSKISHPAAEHFRQVQIYLRLLTGYAGDLASVTEAVIIYEHKADQQVREFVVTYDPKWTDHIFDEAQAIVWALDHDHEVACPHKQCKSCVQYE